MAIGKEDFQATIVCNKRYSDIISFLIVTVSFITLTVTQESIVLVRRGSLTTIHAVIQFGSIGRDLIGTTCYLVGDFNVIRALPDINVDIASFFLNI